MIERLARRYGWIYRPVVIAMLIAILISGFAFGTKAVDAINNRTFDSQTQKSNVLEMHGFLLEMKMQEREEAVRRKEVKMHRENENIHMSKEEKEQLIVIREAVIRILDDVQEIKKSVKK